MEKKIGSFTANDDGGRQYIINIYTDFIDVSTFKNPRAVSRGLDRLQTTDGMVVNRIKKGEYKIVETGTLLRSDSPDAP